MKKNQSSGVKKKTSTKPDKKSDKKPEEIGKYHLTIFLGGEKFETDTNNIAKAILDLHPPKITNKVVIRIQRGKSFVEKVLYVFPARRIFNVPLATDFFAKNIILLLK
jgi:hypothetical protein